LAHKRIIDFDISALYVLCAYSYSKLAIRYVGFPNLRKTYGALLIAFLFARPFFTKNILNIYQALSIFHFEIRRRQILV